MSCVFWAALDSGENDSRYRNDDGDDVGDDGNVCGGSDDDDDGDDADDDDVCVTSAAVLMSISDCRRESRTGIGRKRLLCVFLASCLPNLKDDPACGCIASVRTRVRSFSLRI